MKAKVKKEKNISRVPEHKKLKVKEIAEKIKKANTVMVVSTKSLPASQFQKIKKSLRGKAEIIVARKSIVIRAIGTIEKGALQNLKEQIGSDVAVMFSDIDAFELAGILIENQSATKAKAGDIAPEDITVEAGPTDLIPGPAISELGSVGLKVKVEAGKLAVIQKTTIVKAGEKINEKVASVMGKLNIAPMKVGFIPVAAYDAKSEMIYLDIKIDKDGALSNLREAISKALGFAVNVEYITKETISYFIVKAGREENALKKIIERDKKIENNANNDKEGQ